MTISRLCIVALFAASTSTSAIDQFEVTGLFDRDSGQFVECGSDQEYRLVIPSNVEIYLYDRAAELNVDPFAPLRATYLVEAVSKNQAGVPRLGVRKLLALDAEPCGTTP